ncbi:Uma2 family endonuclease [bacterium CPR1]|nr:Uma2 family endonuclease [bacterium CPR1]
MPTTTSEQRVVLRCSWETYERLLREGWEKSAPRLTFNRGELEIMSPSFEHETITGALSDIVQALARHRGLDLIRAGSTTYRRADLEKGFEPDASFYLSRARQVRGLTQIDLSQHPAPELVIEVDLSGSSMPKLAIFLALEVEEVWRWQKGRLEIHLRVGTDYSLGPESRLLPGVRAEDLTRLVGESVTLPYPDWNRCLEDWVTR